MLFYSVNKEQYFRNQIKKYYKKNGRKFFWRKHNVNHFQILLVELFLKKTKAEIVEKHGITFVKKYTDNHKIFLTNKNKIYNSIKMLGLANQRTRAIKIISEYIHKEHNDKVPRDFETLINIPYIGNYTASAIMCFAYDERYHVLDVNSSRIISRYFSIENNKDIRNNSELKTKALDIMPRKDFKEYNWGLLDLGAVICKKNPDCDNCPLNKKCDYYQFN
jgi:A/G-specific adenine glycosylase